MYFNAKHPILLKWKHHAVELFSQNEHKDNQNEGTEHVRNIVQQKMWILGIWNALRSIKNKCLTCRKDRAQTIALVMANLPHERLDDSTTFTNVGVDCFGPFPVKIGRRNVKRWCFLFICLTMRAVHIEVVPKLDIDSCRNAIMRFLARRGKPSTIISDNGTNFVTAEKESTLRYTTKKGSKNILFNEESDGSSTRPQQHFGRVWERLVTSCRKGSYTVLGDKSVPEDALSTTMCIVEQTLKARPMTPVNSDVSDLEALAPFYFLATRTFAYPIYHAQKSLIYSRSIIIWHCSCNFEGCFARSHMYVYPGLGTH